MGEFIAPEFDCALAKLSYDAIQRTACVGATAACKQLLLDGSTCTKVGLLEQDRRVLDAETGGLLRHSCVRETDMDKIMSIEQGVAGMLEVEADINRHFGPEADNSGQL